MPRLNASMAPPWYRLGFYLTWPSDPKARYMCVCCAHQSTGNWFSARSALLPSHSPISVHFKSLFFESSFCVFLSFGFPRVLKVLRVFACDAMPEAALSFYTYRPTVLLYIQGMLGHWGSQVVRYRCESWELNNSITEKERGDSVCDANCPMADRLINDWSICRPL